MNYHYVLTKASDPAAARDDAAKRVAYRHLKGVEGSSLDDWKSRGPDLTLPDYLTEHGCFVGVTANLTLSNYIETSYGETLEELRQTGTRMEEYNLSPSDYPQIIRWCHARIMDMLEYHTEEQHERYLKYTGKAISMVHSKMESILRLSRKISEKATVKLVEGGYLDINSYCFEKTGMTCMRNFTVSLDTDPEQLYVVSFMIEGDTNV